MKREEMGAGTFFLSIGEKSEDSHRGRSICEGSFPDFSFS